MCGIAGFWRTIPTAESELADYAEKMARVLAHRGPDDEGYEVFSDGPVLCHRRLSIIDTSCHGHQPMVSHSGRYTVVFNGEIYNFLALRSELERTGVVFRTRSDTEVLLAAIEAWGVKDGVVRSNGMFAFALWDKEERCLWLGRDRLGKKPLYYGWSNGTFLFASELKSIRAHPDFNASIDREALTLYFRHNYIPAPYSIYRGFKKLPAAHLARISLQEIESRTNPELHLYWDLRSVAQHGTRVRAESSESCSLEELDKLLSDAVGIRMIADVPLGAFLSGGIDSSLVVALMQEQSSSPIRTFTIGYGDREYNEAHDAAQVAKHLGTEHTELQVSPEDALAVIPNLPTMYDEPFADASQIPTFLISQLARRHVTVALSGDGGDEIFGGYNRYFWSTRIWNNTYWIPQSLRAKFAWTMRAVSPARWDRMNRAVAPLLPASKRVRMAGDRIHKLAGLLDADDEQDLYTRLTSLYTEPSNLVIGGAEPSARFRHADHWGHVPTFVDRMMYLDTRTYLPDDILVKVDRASMSVSLETRAPLLDYRVCEFAWTMPIRCKVNNGKGKYALRELLHRRVPRKLIERPKMGFGVPIDLWLRGPLREWAEDLLDENRLRAEGFVDPQPVVQKWREHLSGTNNWQYFLWAVLVFQMWVSSERSF